MKLQRNTLILLFFLIIPLSLFSNKLNLTKEEKAFIKEHPIIKFSDVKWQPFFDIKDDKYSGIFKEYYKLIENRTGLKFEFVKFDDGLNFQTVLDALKNKKIDMIDGTGKTKSRSSYSIYSNPLMKVSLAIVSDSSKRYTSLEELKDKRIVVAKGSTASEYLKEYYSDKELIYTNGLKEAMSFVNLNKADALIDNIVVLDYLIKKYEYENVQISGVPNYDFTIYALIRDDYKVLQSILNKAIKSISKEELYNINNLLIVSSLLPKEKKINFNKKEKKYIEEKVIKVAMLKEFYPFSFLENDVPKGYSYELMKLISNKSNLKVEYSFDTWNNNLVKFENKDVDLIDSISYSPQRDKFIYFTPSYFQIPNVIFSRKNEFHDFKGFESLKGKKVGITKGIYYYKDLKNVLVDINFVEYESLNDSLRALYYNKIDAVLGNFIAGQNHIKDNLYTNIEIVDELDKNLVKREDLRIGIQEDDLILQSIISKTFNEISLDDKKRLNEKWFSASLKNETKQYISFDYDELEYLNSINTIRMCVDPNWEPYEMIKNGRYEGLVSDFIKLIEKKIDKRIELIVTKNWMESLDYAKNKRCQFLPFLNETISRKEFLNFTPALYKEPDVIVTKNDTNYIYDLNSLDGKSIAVVKGYITPEQEKQLDINVKIRYVSSSQEALILVSEGKVFATIGSFLGTVDKMKELNLPNIKIASKVGIENSYKMGVIKSEPILHSILSKAVDSITSKEKENILNNYISITIDSQINYNLLYKIYLVVLVISLFFIYRHYQIKRMNKKLKQMVEIELEKSRDKDKLLFQQNKMVSMGQMLENIAHQWRQPLSQINSSVLIIDEIFSKEKVNNPELYTKLNEIESMTKYMSNTIDDFKQFVSIDKHKTRFNVVKTIKKSIEIVDAAFLHEKINLIIKYSEDNITFEGFSNNLQQVMLVILNNTKDAFILRKIKNGTVTIEIKEKSESCIITVSDNAGGIDKDVKDKIFEPYFTTKHPSLGTGLGLYISKKILEKSMNGIIEVFNINKGAKFVITLRKNNEH